MGQSIDNSFLIHQCERESQLLKAVESLQSGRENQSRLAITELVSDEQRSGLNCWLQIRQAYRPFRRDSGKGEGQAGIQKKDQG